MGRRELLTLISGITATTAIAIDLMLPAFGDIRQNFGLSEGSNQTGQIVTVFFYGLALGHLFYGPLADRFGRKPSLYLGIGIYVIGASGSAIAPSFDVLLVSRFVWGLGAAGCRVVATAIVRDRFKGKEMAKAMSQIMAVFILVPVFAPSVGSLVLLVAPWPWVFWLSAIFAAVVGLWSLRLRETLLVADRREISPTKTVGSYVEVARTPLTFGYTMAAVFLQGGFTAYLASVDLIVGDIFGRDAQFALIFGAVAVLFGIGALLNGKLVDRFGIDRTVVQAFRCQHALVVVLLVITIAGNGRPEFWLFTPVLGLFLSSNMFIMPNVNSAAMTPVGHLAGTASALTGAARMAGGALIGGLLASTLVDSLTPLVVGLMTTSLAAAVCTWLARTGRNVRSAGSKLRTAS